MSALSQIRYKKSNSVITIASIPTYMRPATTSIPFGSLIVAITQMPPRTKAVAIIAYAIKKM